MKRTPDQALEALRTQIGAWAKGRAKPDLRVFVYPPEWEALMLLRLPEFAKQCSAQGEPVELVDVGRAFLKELSDRNGLIERLSSLDRAELLDDLGWTGTSCLKKLMRSPLNTGDVCRILINTGALATFVSYSAVANELTGPVDPAVPATVLAFPGEGDERSLNLLRLRVDTNYRIPRI